MRRWKNQEIGEILACSFIQAKHDVFFFLKSLLSLHADPDSVTKVPGDRFGPDILERGVCEAIKADLLFGDSFQLELVTVCIGQNHLNEACSVSLLDMMKE
jgi:hypothetical protein